MRTGALVLIGLGVVSAGPADAQQPFEGYWAGRPAACRNPDSDERLAIEGRAFSWYETRCQASAIRMAGPQSWTMNLSCEGEGERFQVKPRISLQGRNRLVIENGPVGPNPRRQTYMRCAGP